MEIIPKTFGRRKHMPEYEIYHGIIKRCYNSKCKIYKYYGGRGIVMSKEWLDNFDQFYFDMGDRPSLRHSVDRIDNDGNYEAGNCRWADRGVQARNARPSSRNKVGCKGVNYYRRLNKWTATISVNGVRTYLGRYDRLEDAIKVRKEAENLYGYHLL